MQRFLFRLFTLCLVCALPASAQFGIFKSKPETKPSPNNPLAGNASKQPDKELFDKAMTAMKKGKFDVARLDLQTLLNTYPESEYQMRAKLAVGDSWFKEGGTAALTQAEAEYKDFITFFPNQPEAAEAQMKVADIYYMQMEKPDRDPKNANQAEQEYRTMIQQFPDSTFVPRAKQRLREVQEVLAEREYQVGSFYASHENWAASIARLQTVTDSYPLYSHSDLALIGLGDAYAAEARFVQGLNLKQITDKAKQDLMKAYDDQAADAYSRVVTKYSMAAHVEDARERLIALNRAVPEPTKEQLADSEAEEQSRTGITFKDRALLLVKRGPVTVNAARIGEPTLTDPPPVTAPAVHARDTALFIAAGKGEPLPPVAGPAPAATAVAASANATPAPDSGSTLQLENVPNAENGAPARSGGPAIGAEIVSPSESAAPASSGPPTSGPPTSAPPTSAPTTSATPAAGTLVGPPVTPEGAAAAAQAAGVPGAQNPGGLMTVAPANNQPLPPIEKPAEAAPQTNDVAHPAAQVQTGTTTGATNGKKKKTPAPKYDSSSESSSKHKQKKGIDKLNPF
jgi:outer membrane protein assembly factor BamD